MLRGQLHFQGNTGTSAGCVCDDSKGTKAAAFTFRFEQEQMRASTQVRKLTALRFRKVENTQFVLAARLPLWSRLCFSQWTVVLAFQVRALLAHPCRASAAAGVERQREQGRRCACGTASASVHTLHRDCCRPQVVTFGPFRVIPQSICGAAALGTQRSHLSSEHFFLNFLFIDWGRRHGFAVPLIRAFILYVP